MLLYRIVKWIDLKNHGLRGQSGMTQLHQALENYCTTKQHADRQSLKTALVTEYELLEIAQKKILKDIKTSDFDRFQSIIAFRGDFNLLADMIILFGVDNVSCFNISEYNNDYDFIINAAKRVRQFVDSGRLRPPPKIKYKQPRGKNKTTRSGNKPPPPPPTAATAPTPPLNVTAPRLVVPDERPELNQSRPDRTPIEESWINERMPRFKKKLFRYLEKLAEERRGGRNDACNTANLLVACALADFMGVCRYLPRDAWEQLVDDARWFFIQRARAIGKHDEQSCITGVVDLLVQRPIPIDFEQIFLAKIRITPQSKCDRINRVQAVVQDDIRKLHEECDYNLASQ